MAVVWVEAVSGGRTASGRVRPAAAAVMTAVDGSGGRLVDVVVRFAGVGGHGVPRDACSPAEGAMVLGRALSGRQVLAWTEAQVSVLSGRLERLGHSLRLEVISSQPGAGWDGWPMSVRDRVAQWRGQ